MDVDKLFLIIRNRERVLFEGEVKAVTSQSDKGVFDILAEHTSFICLIKERVIVHTLDGGTQEIKITQGIVKVYMNRVSVYLGVLSDSRELKARAA